MLCAETTCGAGHTAEILKDCPLCADEINACAADTDCDAIMVTAIGVDDFEATENDLANPLFMASCP